MSTSSRKTVSALKQSFEANDDLLPGPSSPTPHPKQKQRRIGLAANMDVPKTLVKIQEAAQPAINAVVETVSSLAPAVVRPSTSKHPSWVGPKPPERPSSPYPANMQYPVTIDFYLPGTQPPVYIATDLSKPQWRPVEMDSAQDEQGEYRFSMSFEAEHGEYQYKLRLGPGDWWICDNSVAKITDNDGNENNLIVVKPDIDDTATSELEGDGSDAASTERQHSIHPAPLMSHEKPIDAHHHHHLVHQPSQEDLHRPEAQVPLFRHESLASPASGEIDDTDDDNDEVLESSPLLRHETIAPSSQEQEHSPLFRHESTAIDNQQHHEDINSHASPHPNNRKHSHDSIPEEADPDDPSLEKFPTDHRGILQHLDRTRQSLQEDETSEDRGGPRRHSSAGSMVAHTSPSLPSVTEDDGEEEQDAASKSGEADATAHLPRVTVAEPQERPFAPMTPPMTPKDERKVEDDSRLEEAEDDHVGISDKVEYIKEKACHKAKEAAHSGLPALTMGLAVAMAAASAAVAFWYIKTKNDNVVL